MNEERDFVVFSDDEGNEFELDVIDYFEYEGNEYAVLMDLGTEDDEELSGEQDVYIMKVVVNDDIEEFLPAEEEKMEALTAIVEERLNQLDDDECGGCCCGSDSCHHEE